MTVISQCYVKKRVWYSKWFRFLYSTCFHFHFFNVTNGIKLNRFSCFIAKYKLIQGTFDRSIIYYKINIWKSNLWSKFFKSFLVRLNTFKKLSKYIQKQFFNFKIFQRPCQMSLLIRYWFKHLNLIIYTRVSNVIPPTCRMGT